MQAAQEVNRRKQEKTMARNKRNSKNKYGPTDQSEYDLVDRVMALFVASVEVTRGITTANEDLAKDPNDERAQSAFKLFEITIPVLVDWGAEVTKAMDKECSRATEVLGKEMRDRLHEVFQVQGVN